MIKPHSSKGATMSEITYSQAKQLVLARLREVMMLLPVSERPRPRYVIAFKSYSILSLISEVERDSDVGKSWIYSEMERLGYAIS